MRKTFFCVPLICALTVYGYAADSKSTAKAKKEIQKALKYSVENKFEKMLESARKAKTLDPSLPMPYAYSGLYLYRMEQMTAAEVDFQKSLALDPNQALARIYLGSILFDRGNSERALDEWSVGVRLESKNPEALASMALALFLIGKNTEAIQHYKRALTYDRRYYDPPFLLDRKKGAAWSKKKVDAVLPLLQKVEKPKFPY